MTISDFVPQLVLMLAGALLASIGLGHVARRTRGQALLRRIPAFGIVLLTGVLVTASGGGLYWFARRVLDSAGGGEFTLSTGGFLALGLLVGLAFSLPGIVLAWSEARSRGKKQRTAPPTREERRAFAAQLADQIHRASDRATNAVVRAGGDGERVLFIEAGLDSQQGNRLVAALRVEMAELGFKRVEGTGGGGDWWAPV